MRRWWVWVLAAAAVYGLVAYVVLPQVWAHHEHQPGLAGTEAVTHTAEGIPGDPLNVGLVGDRTEVLKAMAAAGWTPADPITLASSIEIAASVALDRPDTDAPVSPLYYQGRKQDLAFEQQIGDSADRRNHVRLWQVMDSGAEGRPVWLGSATEDAGVTLSRDTGQVTHRISPDVDAERDLFIGDLVKAGMVTQLYQVSGVGPTLNGRNGEGDPYQTDGDIHLAVLSPGAVQVSTPPEALPDPVLVQGKNLAWSQVMAMFGPDPGS
jgi:hypothetical protein